MLSLPPFPAAPSCDLPGTKHQLARGGSTPLLLDSAIAKSINLPASAIIGELEFYLLLLLVLSIRQPE
jgi:hypothetical protein